MIYVFWQLHGDAVIFGLVLFAAYATLLVAALRKQLRIHERQLARVRGQRDRARARVRNLAFDTPIPYAPVWTTGAPREAINAEFDALMTAAFVADEGGEG